jgi:uncharacterized membrane protein
MNDLPIRKFLRLYLAVQLGVLGSVALENIGFSIPFVREVTCFVYLIFIPGIVILKIARVHGLGTTETFLYAVGLSVSFSMFVGLFMNALLPLLGILNPLSASYLIPAIFTITSALVCIAYKIDAESPIAPAGRITVPSFFVILFLGSLPLLSIVGTYLVNFYGTNSVLLILILAIAVIIMMASVTDNLLPTKYSPLLVGAIALALMFHRSLISPNVTGYDIHIEYYFAQLTLTASHWDPTISHIYNSTLTDTILPTVYSLFLGLQLTWVYKIIYPLLFSLVPVALYRTYAKQFDKRIALLGIFFFMSLTMFYDLMASLMKQEIAEFFWALLILLLLEKRLVLNKKAILFLVFSFSLVVSHYGTAFVWLFFMLLGLFTLTIMKYRERSLIDVTAIALYGVVVFMWYVYVSNSIGIDTVVRLGSFVYTNISDILDFGTRESSILILLGLQEPASIWRDAARFLYQTSIVLIGVGLATMISKRQRSRVDRQFLAMSVCAVALLLMSLGLPYFAEFFHASRIYHMTLFFLSPFCIIGATKALEYLSALPSRLARGYHHSFRVPWKAVLLSTFLVLYFLFNSGFVYQVTGDVPSSLPLSMSAMKASRDPVVQIEFNSMYSSDLNIASAHWLSERRGGETPVYSDKLSQSYVLSSFGMIFPALLLDNATQVRPDSYVYLSQLNVIDGIVYTGVTYYPLSQMHLNMTNTVYSDGSSKVCYL